MMKKHISLLLILTLLIGSIHTAFAADASDPGTNAIYVAPYGNDSNPGTIDAPLGTLQGAVNAVNKELGSFIELIDTSADGSKGNIIAYGKISGKFTDARFRGDRTVDKNKPYYM